MGEKRLEKKSFTIARKFSYYILTYMKAIACVDFDVTNHNVNISNDVWIQGEIKTWVAMMSTLNDMYMDNVKPKTQTTMWTYLLMVAFKVGLYTQMKLE